jgi:hypothetical protein
MPDLRIGPRGGKGGKRWPDARARGRNSAPFLLPFLLAVLAALGVSFGWYRSQDARESERVHALQRLSSAEQELAEAKGDLDHCKAWMDARLPVAQAPERGPAAFAAATPVGTTEPTASASTGGEAAGAASDGGETRQTRLRQRRHRMLELRGQTNSDL